MATGFANPPDAARPWVYWFWMDGNLNREARAVEVECAFRVEGRKPECWDPLTGRARDLQAFREAAGCTAVPLRFEPRRASGGKAGREVAPDLRAALLG